MIKSRLLLILLILTIFAGAIILAGCPAPPDVVIKSGPRILKIDIRNNVFNKPTETDPGERGLDIDTIAVTVHTVDGKGKPSSEYSASLPAASIDPAEQYTQISIPIDGILGAVTASAKTFGAELSEIEEGSPLLPHTVFENIEKFKIDCVVNDLQPSNSTLRILPCPRGGASPAVAIDSGEVEDSAAQGLTDRAAEIDTKQIAFSIAPAEHPLDLTFDVYYTIADDNIAVTYNPSLTFDANYTQFPWTPAWTLEEIESLGKRIGPGVYRLTRYNTMALNILNPAGDGKTSYLMDFAASTEEGLTDKFMLLAIVLRYGEMSSPLDVRCIDIK